MQTQAQTQQRQEVQGFISSPRVFISAERAALVHVLAEEIRIEMPINYYKKILGIPFEKMERPESQETAGAKRNVYGLIARPNVFLSKDKNYLIHRVLGVRVSKHVNYYKQILGAKAAPTQTAEEQLTA
jgi:hypothetical protein